MTKRAALDIALCGAGAAAALHALAAQHLPGAIVRVVAAPRRDRAEAFARQIGARAVGLDDLPAACPLVIVAAPPSAHEAAAGPAVRGGASVLVESPLAPTSAAAARLAGVGPRVGAADNLAFAPLVLAACDRIGALGPLRWLEVEAHAPPPAAGGAGNGANPALDPGARALVLAFTLAEAAGEAPEGFALVHAAIAGERAELTLARAGGPTVRVSAGWRRAGSAWSAQAASDHAVLRLELSPHPHLEANGADLAHPAGAGLAPIVEYGYVGQLRAVVDELARGGLPGRMPALDARRAARVAALVEAARGGDGEPRA